MTRVSLHTLGCKVNQYDAAALHEALGREGLQVVEAGQPADVIVVNTCTVTAAADRQNRQIIRRLRRDNPTAVLIVTGCQAEVSQETLMRMPEVDLVIGNRGKGAIPQLIVKALDGAKWEGDGHDTRDFLWEGTADHLPGRTRAFLKVQDGCDASCSYCIVPLARGRSRSRPLESVLREIERMELAGIHEVVLTGIHLGNFGKDLYPPSSLVQLLDRLQESSKIPRIRLSSIEPLEADDPLLRCIGASRRICPHLHLPLQSGDDEMLAWMNRPYGVAFYRERALRALEMVPNLTLGADVIVGFPGESASHFERTLRFIEGMPFTYLHIFPFSPRPGTRAWSLPDRVPPSEVKARAQALRELSQARRIAAMSSYLGKTLEVLVEREKKGRRGWMEGLTSNYLRALVAGNDEMRNKIVPVQMDRVDGIHLVGRPV
jgi:threonylcarbamoyladenosine tRNA methylthiotransferase MtaB